MAETLEQLMQEFQSTAAPPPVPAQPAPQQQMEQASIDRHARDAAVAETEHQRNTRALEQAVQQFKRTPDLAGESSTLIEGYLLARARRDDAFNEAVSSGDPARAEQALATARRDYQNELRGGYIESDTLRARASVRAGADQPDAPPELSPLQVSRLSDQEYDSYMSKRIGTQTRPPNNCTSCLRAPSSFHLRSRLTIAIR